MINQPGKKVKAYNTFALNSDFMMQNINALYNAAVSAIENRTMNVLLACCQVLSLVSGYILYGTYERTVTDIRCNRCNGLMVYEIVTVKLRIQRIMCNRCGKKHTHALLFDYFVPYGRYSIRFILYYLDLYFKSGMSIEAFCGEHEELFSERTFNKWLQWLNNNMDMLIQQGIVTNSAEHKEHRKQCVETLLKALSRWICCTLKNTNKMPFQRHATPNNTNYRNSSYIMCFEEEVILAEA